jgi:hypothetical protein
VGSRERFISTAAKMANVVLGAGAVVCACAFAYFLYHYAWVRDRQFTGWLGVVLYYGVPTGLALLLFLAMRLKADRKINLALVCLALTASVYGAELALWLTQDPFAAEGYVMSIVQSSWDRKKLTAELTRRFGRQVDSRRPLEVITDLRRAGVDAVPFVIPRLQLRYQSDVDPLQILGLGGISNKLTVLCNESGEFITYESDEHGFRNPKGVWQAGRAEIAAVGDSYTQGYCVPFDKSFVGLIGQRYPRTFNLGMAGEGPLLMLATIHEYVSRLKPRVVLWFYFEGNDLWDLADERRSPLLMRYLQDDVFSQGLFARQTEIDQAVQRFVEKETERALKGREERERTRNALAEASAGVVKLNTLRRRLGLVGGVSAEDAQSVSELATTAMPARGIEDLFRTVLSAAQTRVSSWGGRLYFVYLPGWPDDTRRLTPVAEQQRGKVLGIARALGLPTIDILPRFQAESDPLGLLPFRMPNGGHYNERGHAVVAETVLDAIGNP